MNRWTGGAWERVVASGQELWREKGPFTHREGAELHAHCPVLPAQTGQVLLQGGQVLHIGHRSIDHQHHLPKSRLR